MLRLVAVAPGGLQREASQELRALGGGIGKTRYEDGRIRFEGPPDAVYRCNLALRMVERILVEVGQVTARSREEFSERVAGLPWELWLPPGVRLRVHASAKACRLYHTGAISDALLAGIAARGSGPGWARGDDPVAEVAGKQDLETDEMVIDARGTRDRWTLCVDSTGPGLHRRGYRKDVGKAPIRETAASALLQVAGWTPEVPLLDPMCGSGTFAIEAAWAAQRRSPGLMRSFSFERFPSLDQERWVELKRLAEDRIDASPGRCMIQASDIHPEAVKAARANARRAQLTGHLDFVQRPLEDLPSCEQPNGLVVLNPPYGHRLSLDRKAEDSWSRWGEVIRERCSGWSVLLLSPDPLHAQAFGAPGRSKLRFAHGGLRVGVWVVTLG